MKSHAQEETKDTLSTRIPRTSYTSKPNPSFDNVISLQRTIGNQAVQKLFESDILGRSFGGRQRDVASAHSTGRVADREMTPSEPLMVQRQSGDEETKEKGPTFKTCEAKIQEVIKKGVKKAEELANGALKAIKKDIPLTHEYKAFTDHFGSVTADQKKTVVSCYEHIVSTLGSKEFVCKAKCKEGKGVRLCAQGETPGNKIYICPNFGVGGCDPGQTILHEAAHNAGASKDIDQDEKYPPKNAEKNAYSYEYFAVDLRKGPPEVKLPPRKEVEIKIPGE